MINLKQGFLFSLNTEKIRKNLKLSNLLKLARFFTAMQWYFYLYGSPVDLHNNKIGHYFCEREIYYIIQQNLEFTLFSRIKM